MLASEQTANDEDIALVAEEAALCWAAEKAALAAEEAAALAAEEAALAAEAIDGAGRFVSMVVQWFTFVALSASASFLSSAS